MIKQSLQQRMQQKLSPQQIQVIKLLEIPVMELEQRIKREIEENPVLEEGAEVDEDLDNDEELENSNNNDEFTLDDYINEEDQTPSYKLKANNYSKDDKAKPIIQAAETSYRELLRSQLLLQDFNENEKQIARFLIDTLDDDGYIRRELDSVADDLAFKQNLNVESEDVSKVLEVIKENFDPVGVGAESLADCLLIQLRRKEKKTFYTKVAEEILSDYFEEFSKKHYQKIIKQLEISEDDIKQAIEEIIKLNPKPGNSSGNSATKNIAVVTPDFVLENNDGELYVTLNSRNTPELRLSKYYTNMLTEISVQKKQTKDQKKGATFVKQKMDSARWFIDAIKQREQTLMHTIEAIIKYQHQYFLEGDETKLKPMRLKDIAAITDLDISTISRVSNSKYIQTEFGVKKLKSFFSEGIMNEEGEEISTKEIKKILQEVIIEEDKKKPLTDDKLSLLLKDKGYPIARRTVAKYREQLKIPVGRLRKEL